MINDNLYPGLFWDKSTEHKFKLQYPFAQIIKTKGDYYALDENNFYLVRLGKKSVIMPRMVYSKEAHEAFLHLYGEE